MESNISDDYLRMDLTKNDLFLEILSFLEGVSQFLGNDFFDASSLSDEDKTKLGEQRRALHIKSNYLWKLFNMSVLEDKNSYLNMEKRNSHKVDATTDQTYDYCSFETEIRESEEFPYTDLSTEEIISKATFQGELVQVGRRSFFGKPKTMFVILVDRWLLIYGSKGEKRPIQHIFVKKCERLPEDKHSNGFKVFSQKDEKSSEFQCSSEKQANEWVTAIENAIKLKRTSHGYVNVNKSVNIRKLPTPPAITYRKSNKSDDIYEEPDVLNVRKSAIEKQEKLEKKEEQEELTYDNVDHSISTIMLDMPHIPVKLGSFKGTVCPNYDVPKNNRLVVVENVKRTSTIEEKTSEADANFIKNPRKSPQASTSRINVKNVTSSSVQNTEEIKEKLRQQGIILTPIKTHPVSSSKSTSKFSLSSPTKDLNKQTIKNWFKIKKRKSVSESNSEKSEETTIIQKSPQITAKTVNNNSGSKVNMIIHQLEANGHLKHLLTKSKDSTKIQRRHTIVDDSYDFVSTTSHASKICKEIF